MTRSFLLLTFCTFLGGCDSINVVQYRITGTDSSEEDRMQIRDVLDSVATKAELVNQTSTSRAANTVVYYVEPDVQHFQVELGARGVEDYLIVDLYAGFGPQSAKFKQVARLLDPALTQVFGTRVTELEFDERVP